MPLVPCKFCGGQATFGEYDIFGAYGEKLSTHLKVVCPNCHFEVHSNGKDYVNAALCWNSENKTPAK